MASVNRTRTAIAVEDEKLQVKTEFTLVPITGLLKGNGSSPVSLAVANTDYLPVASPAMTGTPTAPTAAAGTNTTQLATTAFVVSNLGRLLRLTGSGNGTSTTISISHGLTGITSTSKVLAGANSANAAGWTYVTVDATNVNFFYTTAPVSGTNNLIYSVNITA